MNNTQEAIDDVLFWLNNEEELYAFARFILEAGYTPRQATTQIINYLEMKLKYTQLTAFQMTFMPDFNWWKLQDALLAFMTELHEELVT